MCGDWQKKAMQNILNQKADLELDGRLRESVSFVSDDDLASREVLDIGCGYGWFELNALRRGVSRIVGVEITAGDLSAARDGVTDPRAEFITGSGTKLPFADDSFDTVVSWEVLEHIPKGTEMEMYHEVRRVLREGGVFYLSTPFGSFFSNVFDPAWWLIGHRHYGKERLTAFAAGSSFVVLDMKIKGRWWNLLGILNMYIAKWIFRRRPFFNHVFLPREMAEFGRDNGFMNIFVKYRKM